MSGGVDSSVTVLRLLQAGHEVVGIHLLLAPEATAQGQAASDAVRVAGQLGISCHVIDRHEEFRHRVMEPFAREYLAGHTPNPCVRCNQWIKFGLMWEEARKLGCDRLATGHYARIGLADGQPALFRGADRTKDQSYFLWRMDRDMLSRVLFPLGDLAKTDTRAMAADAGLVTAKKSESQEICFVPNDDYIAFLQAFCPDSLPDQGQFTDASGKVLGTHRGAYRYTIGQRRGLGLALGYPAYVTVIDSAAGRVTVGTNADLMRTHLTADDVRFLADCGDSGTADFKIRSRGPATPGRWQYDGTHLQVEFDSPVRAVTPGQSVVLYDGDRVLGGGIITNE